MNEPMKYFKWIVTGYRDGHEVGKYVYIPPWEREGYTFIRPDAKYRDPVSKPTVVVKT